MTIDETILQEKEMARTFETKDFAEYHEQVAEWLEELKMYKSLSPRELVSEKQKNDRAIEYNKGFDYGFKTGYNKAIDDFAEKLIRISDTLAVGNDNTRKYLILHFNEIAEQLKEGKRE